MKSVRCSWIDMQKVRASLSGGNRGDQAALLKIQSEWNGDLAVGSPPIAGQAAMPNAQAR